MNYTPKDVYRLDSNMASSLCNALRVAAERFDEDAETVRQSFEAGGGGMLVKGEGSARLVEQFKRQAGEARCLANMFQELIDANDNGVNIATFISHKHITAILKGKRY